MIFIIIAWFVVAGIFVGVPGFYYLQMKKWSKKPWKLNLCKNFNPSLAVLVPVHNEEKTIRLKLDNLKRVQYPKDKVEILIVNDASADNTLTEINRYVVENPSLKIGVFNSKEHLGKSACLNQALKSVKAEIVIISDADCFWPADILENALPYLSDPNIGAITGRELLLNPHDTWVTLGEEFYNNSVQSVRIGESKMHSTIFFQGGFAAYKINTLFQFNNQTDDSGTALDIIQRNMRAILLSDIGFYTTSPAIWRNKIAIKIRRASQLQNLWVKCLHFLVNGKLLIPTKIAIPEIFIHIFNPILLALLGALSLFVFLQYPIFLLVILLASLPLLIIRKTRISIIEVFQNNLILLASLPSLFTRNKFSLWKTVRESRSLITEDFLREKNLI